MMTPAHAALIAKVREALAKATTLTAQACYDGRHWYVEDAAGYCIFDGLERRDAELAAQAPAWLAALCDALEGIG